MPTTTPNPRDVNEKALPNEKALNEKILFELKPNKTAFITYRFLIGFFSTLFFFAVAYVIINIFYKASVLYFLAIFAALEGIKYYSLTVRFRKERYIFLPQKIIRKSGGIFSEYNTELVIKNITHLKMTLPYIENKLFSTGHIEIQSAGSSFVEVYLSSLNNYGKTYEHIQGLMQKNGFKLSKAKLVQEEKPSLLGVFFESARSLISAIFFMFIAASYAWGNIALIKSHIALTLTLSILIALPVVLFLLLYPLLLYMDLKNRVYRVYADAITYKEGFLTEHFAVMPIENLSDTSITQTLVDKLFGLYDVKISCQGAGQEILFKNMRNGSKLRENIQMLVKKTTPLVGTYKTDDIKANIKNADRMNKAAEPNQATARYAERKAGVTSRAALNITSFKRDTTYTAEFRLEPFRTLFPILLILLGYILFFVFFPKQGLGVLLPFLIAVGTIFGINLLHIFFMKYSVLQNSMAEVYDFITLKHKEFTNEKIMAVVFKESFVDSWFGTCKVLFWSIGSSEGIFFRNIKKTKDLYTNLLGKLGIRGEAVIYNISSCFSFFEMLKGSFYTTVLSLVLIFASFFIGMFANLFRSSNNQTTVFLIIPMIIVLVYIAVWAYMTVYYARSKMVFFKNYLYFERGIFFKEFYYVPYDNIKDITTIRYPFSSRGSILFDIGGEHIVQRGEQQRIISNSFKINYVKDIETKDELIDLILYHRPNTAQVKDIEANISKYSPAPLMESRPDVINSVIPAIIFFPAIIFIPLIIWSVKVKRFCIQKYRVVERWGIVYKYQTSIIFRKIDYINQSQGMLNKAFNNGNIILNTTGSSMPEMVIKNIPDHQKFYDLLKKNYRA